MKRLSIVSGDERIWEASKIWNRKGRTDVRLTQLTLGNIALAWLAIINGIAFVMYGVDKYKSMHHKWRIPENMLLLLAIAGGSIGAMLGMQVFHHKTKHLKFKYGVPLVFLVQIVVCLYALR